MTFKYSISIISHNQGKLVKKAIDSLSLIDDSFEIIITINIPENEDYLKLIPYELTIIRNNSPLGFGSNHNNAFKKSNGELFLIVNPDITIIKWSKFEFKCNTLYSPLILNSNLSISDFQREYPTIQNILKRKFMKSSNEKMEWIAGMFLIITRDFYKKLGGFDEKFFMYLEDADLSIRVKKKKGIIEIINSLEVVHDAQRDSRRNPKHLVYHVSSLLKFYIKYPYLIFKI